MMNGEAIAAGNFSDWLRDIQSAIEGDGEMDVPCGECNACCRASYFIQVEAKEAQTLAVIPKPLLFPAPGDATGKQVMGFTEQGQCPMLRAEQCSIYDARPHTCRVFDCRVFAATGIYPSEPEKKAVDTRARRWRFNLEDRESKLQAAAVRAAGDFLEAHCAALHDVLPRSTTQLAVLAVRLHDLFLGADSGDAQQICQQIRERVGTK